MTCPILMFRFYCSAPELRRHAKLQKLHVFKVGAACDAAASHAATAALAASLPLSGAVHPMAVPQWGPPCKTEPWHDASRHAAAAAVA